MTPQPLCFSVDSEKLVKLGAHYLHSSDGSAALKAGHLSSDERLFLSILRTPLLNENLFLKNRRIIEIGQNFEDAYFVVHGEVQIQRGNKVHMLGAGSVLGLSEGMAGLASSYTAVASTSVQVKIISFHKINQIVKVLPTELRLIIATIIKRNLTTVQLSRKSP